MYLCIMDTINVLYKDVSFIESFDYNVTTIVHVHVLILQYMFFIVDSCLDHMTCSRCQSEAGCGWCRDPANTGLGTCDKGGFLASLNESFCPDSHWFFDTCPCKQTITCTCMLLRINLPFYVTLLLLVCNCNGHSTCFNNTNVCISCGDNTQGKIAMYVV